MILEVRENFAEILMADYWFQPTIILFTWQLLWIFPPKIYTCKLSLFLIRCSSWLGFFMRFTSIHESYLPFLIKVVFSDSKISFSSQKNLLLKSIASVLSTWKLVGLICFNRSMVSWGKNFER